MAKTVENKVVMNDGLDDLFEFVDHNSFESEKITAPRYSYWKSVGRVFFKKKSNYVWISLMAIILIMAFIWPINHEYITSYDPVLNPYVGNPAYLNKSPSQYAQLAPMSIEWILGTNNSAGSVFNQLWTGTRTSLLLATICTIINMFIGVVLGSVWGLSKTFDSIMNQVFNIVGNVPFVLFISIMMYIIGTGFWSFVFALTITGWLGIAYFIRTQVIIIRDREYNLASRCLGTNIFTIVFKNILPFMISIIVTVIATELPSYISYEVFLSYVGIGLSAKDISIGRIINEAQNSWIVYPWEFWPAVIVSAVVSVVLYVLGQNIGDASDPRTHMA